MPGQGTIPEHSLTKPIQLKQHGLTVFCRPLQTIYQEGLSPPGEQEAIPFQGWVPSHRRLDNLVAWQVAASWAPVLHPDWCKTEEQNSLGAKLPQSWELCWGHLPAPIHHKLSLAAAEAASSSPRASAACPSVLELAGVMLAKAITHA